MNEIKKKAREWNKMENGKCDNNFASSYQKRSFVLNALEKNVNIYKATHTHIHKHTHRQKMRDAYNFTNSTLIRSIQFHFIAPIYPRSTIINSRTVLWCKTSWIVVVIVQCDLNELEERKQKKTAPWKRKCMKSGENKRRKENTRHTQIRLRKEGNETNKNNEWNHPFMFHPLNFK